MQESVTLISNTGPKNIQEVPLWTSKGVILSKNLEKKERNYWNNLSCIMTNVFGKKSHSAENVISTNAFCWPNAIISVKGYTLIN